MFYTLWPNARVDKVALPRLELGRAYSPEDFKSAASTNSAIAPTKQVIRLNILFNLYCESYLIEGSYKLFNGIYYDVR